MVVEKLGEGGMGVVYRAEDTKLRRSVALKFLPRHLAAHGEERDRFLLEAQAASSLNHPNICTIFEIDEVNGETFIVMELVEGTTLREWIQRKIREAEGYRKLAVQEAIDIALQIAEGLQAAHDKQIVHRDVKSENIMVTTDGRVKVMDFGLAKLQGVSKLTKAGSTIGTMAYMSPEQVEGLETDHRTDIWSFGVLLFELFSGKLPFQAVHEAALMYEIINTEPPALGTIRPNIDDEINRIVMKCLEKDRTTRYQSLREVAADLRRFRRNSEGKKLDRSGAAAARAAAPDAPPAPKPASRLRLPVLGTIAAGILIILGIAGYFMYRPSATIRSIAVLPFLSVPADSASEYLGDGFGESLINSLSKLPGMKLMSNSAVYRFKGGQADPQKAGKDLGVDAVLTGRLTRRGDELTISVELINVGDNSHIWGNQYQRRVSDILSVQSEISQEVSDQLKVSLTGDERRALAAHPTANPEAYQLYLKGRYYWNKRTDESAATALGYFQRAIALDPGYALAYSGMADVYIVWSVSATSPEEYMPRLRVAAMKALELDPSLAESHASLGVYKAYFEFDLPGAEAEWRKAISLNPDYATAHHWLGEFLVWQKRFDEGFAEYEKAAAADPLSLAIASDIGAAYYFSRQYDRSIEQLKKTIAMDPNFLRTHFYIMMPYMAKNMPDSAFASLVRGMTVRGDSEAKIDSVRKAYAAEGFKGVARLELEKHMEVFDPQSTFVAANDYILLGDKEKALELLEHAYDAHQYYVITINANPQWDPLRGEPRFTALLKKIGFAP
jgi:serine/threonine-protein kinase